MNQELLEKMNRLEELTKGCTELLPEESLTELSSKLEKKKLQKHINDVLEVMEKVDKYAHTYELKDFNKVLKIVFDKDAFGKQTNSVKHFKYYVIVDLSKRQIYINIDDEKAIFGKEVKDCLKGYRCVEELFPHSGYGTLRMLKNLNVLFTNIVDTYLSEYVSEITKVIERIKDVQEEIIEITNQEKGYINEKGVVDLNKIYVDSLEEKADE